MANNYYIDSYWRKPVWTGPKARPKKKRKESVVTGSVPNFQRQLENADKLVSQYGVSYSDIKFSWNGGLEIQVEESDEKFDKRVETWTKEWEKFKELNAKWEEKQRQKEEKEAQARLNSVEENFVVVKLTPAQYKKLVENT